MPFPVAPQISMRAVWPLMVERCNAAEIAVYFRTTPDVAKSYMTSAARAAAAGKIEIERPSTTDTGEAEGS